MKKINYRVHLGLIGKGDKGINMFVEFLSNLTISDSSTFKNNEFQIIHHSIPLKIKVFQANTVNKFIDLYDSIEYLDGIIQILDIHDPLSIDQILPENFLNFYNLYNFQGSKVLAAMNLNIVNGKINEEILRISRLSLIRKTQELNFIYCFEIINQETDFTELFDKLFDEFILKFKLSNPELYEQALIYGNMLSNQ